MNFNFHAWRYKVKRLFRVSLQYKYRPQCRRNIDPNKSNAEYVRYVHYVLAPKYEGKLKLLKRRLLAYFLEKRALEKKTDMLLSLHGKSIEALTGKTPERQRCEILAFSQKIPAEPRDYYNFEWYLSEQATQAKDYFSQAELSRGGICRVFERAWLDQQNTNALNRSFGTKVVPEMVFFNDKTLTREWALSHGFPVAHVMGTMKQDGVLPDLTDSAFIAKPNFGSDGRGIFKAVENLGFFHLSGQDIKLNQAEFKDCLRPFMRRSHYFYTFEEVLVNHEEISDISGAALSTCRIITILDERGVPEIVGTMFRFAADAKKWTDNASTGGMAAPIDLITGQIGSATRLAEYGTITRHVVHPEKGVPISGRIIPFWQEAKSLCVAAHATLPGMVMAGWDIAITNAGPFIIEVNSNPQINAMQRCHQQPFGPARFGQLVAHNLRRILGDNHRICPVSPL
jgi:hypothetical protein